jgi:hypothetical protein
MATLIPIADFQANYEVKNGYVADAATLNLAVDTAQQEIIALWQFITDNSITDGDKFIDDNPANINDKHVRSIQGLHNEIFNGGTWS